MQYAYCGGNPVNFVDPLGLECYHYNHGVPQEFFEDATSEGWQWLSGMLVDEGGNSVSHASATRAFNSAEFGTFIEGYAHGINTKFGIHGSELRSAGVDWNSVWKLRVTQIASINGGTITIDDLRQLNGEMKSRFSEWLKWGRAFDPTISYSAWRKLAKEGRAGNHITDEIGRLKRDGKWLHKTCDRAADATRVEKLAARFRKVVKHAGPLGKLTALAYVADGFEESFKEGALRATGGDDVRSVIQALEPAADGVIDGVSDWGAERFQ